MKKAAAGTSPCSRLWFSVWVSWLENVLVLYGLVYFVHFLGHVADGAYCGSLEYKFCNFVDAMGHFLTFACL